jgi:hypothetical protein
VSYRNHCTPLFACLPQALSDIHRHSLSAPQHFLPCNLYQTLVCPYPDVCRHMHCILSCLMLPLACSPHATVLRCLSVVLVPTGAGHPPHGMPSFGDITTIVSNATDQPVGVTPINSVSIQRKGEETRTLAVKSMQSKSSALQHQGDVSTRSASHQHDTTEDKKGATEDRVGQGLCQAHCMRANTGQPMQACLPVHTHMLLASQTGRSAHAHAAGCIRLANLLLVRQGGCQLLLMLFGSWACQPVPVQSLRWLALCD